MGRQLKKNLIIFLLVLVLVFVLNLTPGFKNLFYFISAPFEHFFWQKGIETSDFLKGILRTKELKEENERLKLLNQQLLKEIVSKEALEKENKSLKEALKIKPEKDWQLVLVGVVGKSLGEDSILIDKGEDDGILKDMPVVTASFSLVGKVEGVYKRFSEVVLITHPKIKFEAKIKDKDISGLLVGKGEGKLSLELLPKDKEIGQGEIVISGDLQKVFPRNLLVGKIKTIKKVDLKPFQSAQVSPFFDFSYAGPLFVISEY
jgi:rod shape-determining protein MreC